ncbi:uncharacterized protein CLUP02_10850 [Colletotrichum lupini]|uniref:Uncharacterized protein n=1 Tax=Colletotrichum lupini TaxID=145971 RepID=A0A9Q8SY37_9PEZI|nr:uncharacterized protein CLUP02_10850 [Colletotrichum lupini]UQC85353.1 hypothetical protein CLUP02_10850 [Colletotrichum lupini]
MKVVLTVRFPSHVSEGAPPPSPEPGWSATGYVGRQVKRAVLTYTSGILWERTCRKSQLWNGYGNRNTIDAGARAADDSGNAVQQEIGRQIVPTKGGSWPLLLLISSDKLLDNWVFPTSTHVLEMELSLAKALTEEFVATELGDFRHAQDDVDDPIYLSVRAADISPTHRQVPESAFLVSAPEPQQDDKRYLWRAVFPPLFLIAAWLYPIPPAHKRREEEGGARRETEKDVNLESRNEETTRAHSANGSLRVPICFSTRQHLTSPSTAIEDLVLKDSRAFSFEKHLPDGQNPQRRVAKAAAPGADAGQKAEPGRGSEVGLSHQATPFPSAPVQPHSIATTQRELSFSFGIKGELCQHHPKADIARPQITRIAAIFSRFVSAWIDCNGVNNFPSIIQLPPRPINIPALSLTPSGRFGLTLERKFLPEHTLVAKRANLDFWAPLRCRMRMHSTASVDQSFQETDDVTAADLDGERQEPILEPHDVIVPQGLQPQASSGMTRGGFWGHIGFLGLGSVIENPGA